MSNIENEIKILLNLFDSAKFDILISKAKKLIKKSPEYLILYNILGSAYQNIGDLKLAKETFIKGYKMEPNNIAIMNNLANVHKNIGEIGIPLIVRLQGTNAAEAKKLIDESGLKVESVILLQEAADKVAEVVS